MSEVNNKENRFAYYIIPDIEALATEKDPAKLREHRRRIAANIGDQDALRAILGDATEDFHDFYGTEEAPQLSTADTIDSFIEKFGKQEHLANPEDDQPIPVDPPALDYAAIIEEELPPQEDASNRSFNGTLDIIDTFLARQPLPRVKPKKDPKEAEKPSLTESFAKILIKNGNYRRALEIITEISLKNPEKSIYFADQIRFLKKVISLESQ